MPHKKYTKALFIFRRDLRLEDNTGLTAALENSDSVIPCFFVDPRQVGTENDYRSLPAIRFMHESLDDLDQQLRKHGSQLFIFEGTAQECLNKILKQTDAQAVYCNRDYTPFSLKRDQELSVITNSHGAQFYGLPDALLHEPEEIMTGNGTPYTVFTPFYKNYCTKILPKPTKARTNLYQSLAQDRHFTGQKKLTLFDAILAPLYAQDDYSPQVLGGTTQALKHLENLTSLIRYTETRDIPHLSTSNLSAYLKFGCVSIRKTANTIIELLGHNHPLLKQLVWRDFFTHVAYHSPFVFGNAFREKYNNLWWNESSEDFIRWCTGTTGFPLVDAGMRELNKTGFMHNRVRMVVASFLTKDLHIDWQWGEKYFAQKLIDYDPAVNNGNWQWCASTGCDAQPYFRIFNPWLQQEKFDPEARYIKRWVTELSHVAAPLIHEWQTRHKTIKTTYPEPMLDHTQEARKTLELYKSISD